MRCCLLESYPIPYIFVGHVQVLFNKLRGFSSQAALDAPRFCISAGLPDANSSNSSAGDMNSEIWIEDGIPDEVLAELNRKPIKLLPRTASLTLFLLQEEGIVASELPATSDLPWVEVRSYRLSKILLDEMSGLAVPI